MEFGLLLRALSRHKAIVAVLILEFAVTLAILSNALALAASRFKTLQTPSGIRESGLIIATPTGVGAIYMNLDGSTYDALRNLVANQPGVQSVSVIDQIPLSGTDRFRGSISAVPGPNGHPIDVSAYIGDPRTLATLGLSVSAGRWFAVDEFLPATLFPDISRVHLLVLTDSLARKLFNGRNPIGSTVYFGKASATVIGTLNSLSRPNYYGGSRDQDSIFLPAGPALSLGPALAIRMRDDWQGSSALSIKAISAALNRRTQGTAVWSVQTYREMRGRLFTADRAALGLLAAILVAVIGVAANGIAASSGYWVHQRTRQTWIRRAVGATRGRIVAYFMIENGVICGLGVVLGIGLGLAVNLALIEYLNLSRMSVESLVGGALLAFLIGQLAVLRSAIKTAAA